MAPMRPNPTLPEDLVSEILVRVPVKSLLCFQSVCKAWLSLIKHHAFVKSQLRHAIGSEEYISLQITSLFESDSREYVSDYKLPYSGGKINHSILIGSVNGIVCVFNRRDEPNIYLWNPATRQSKLIRWCNTFYPSGFGYDPIDGEYKVFAFGSRNAYSAEVYLANRDEWRRGPDPIDISFIPAGCPFDVCVNGFWCGIVNQGIMVFDLHKEVLSCAIKLPVIVRDVHRDEDEDEDENEDEYDDDEARIIDFNKSIAVIILWDKGGNDGKKINMWRLDDDACLASSGGVEASWTPMFSIDVVMPAELILKYFNNRDLLVLTSDMSILCNADKKEATIVPFSVEMAGHEDTHTVYKYTESLISLPGFKQINWNADEDDNLGNVAGFDIFVPEWLK